MKAIRPTYKKELLLRSPFPQSFDPKQAFRRRMRQKSLFFCVFS